MSPRETYIRELSQRVKREEKLARRLLRKTEKRTAAKKGTE